MPKTGVSECGYERILVPTFVEVIDDVFDKCAQLFNRLVFERSAIEQEKPHISRPGT